MTAKRSGLRPGVRSIAAVFASASWMFGACAEAPPPKAQATELGGGVVARVGADAILFQTVKSIATAQGITAEAALNRAITDALFAEGARQDLPSYEVRSARTRSLARQLLLDLHAESKTKPVSDAELDEATKYNWTFLDRPRGYRTHHVVATFAKGDDEAKHERAKAYAEKARKVLLPVAKLARETPLPERNEEQRFRVGSRPRDPIALKFDTVIEKLDKGDTELEVISQGVGVLAADGAVIEHGVSRQAGAYDADYVKTAVELAEGGRGAVSEVVKSKFGYHVIMLLEVTEPKSLARKERLAWLAERRVIVVQRGKEGQQALLERGRKAVKIEVESNAPALMHKIVLGESALKP